MKWPLILGLALSAVAATGHAAPMRTAPEDGPFALSGGAEFGPAGGVATPDDAGGRGVGPVGSLLSEFGIHAGLAAEPDREIGVAGSGSGADRAEAFDLRTEFLRQTLNVMGDGLGDGMAREVVEFDLSAVLPGDYVDLSRGALAGARSVELQGFSTILPGVVLSEPPPPVLVGMAKVFKSVLGAVSRVQTFIRDLFR